MRHFSRALMSASLGLLAALAFAAPSLGASSTDTIGFVCTVTGTANTTGVDIEGNTGTYSLTNSIVGLTSLDLQCLAHDTRTNEIDLPDLSTTSSGSFNNVQCGTGTADSTNAQNSVTATQIGGNANLHQYLPTASLGYHIDFVDGRGWLYFTDAAIDNYFASRDEDGVVLIVPQFDGAGDKDGTKTVCTRHLLVAGVVWFGRNGSIVG